MPNRPILPHRKQPTVQTPTALAGIRIVDFSRVLAGPFATQILGDLGADIVKVEQVGTGDDSRFLVPNPKLGGESHFFLALNRNKRSIAIDLTTEQGRQVALDLIATADVVLENFTTRVMQHFGLDYESLRERFPRLIYCSISAYGRTGRLANAAGYDTAAYVESGVAAVNSLPGEPPVTGGVPFIDITTALNATIGILAALRARDLHGCGQWIESALYDNAVADLSYKGYQYLASGELPTVMGRRPKFGVPGGLYNCSDGPLWFTCTGQKMYRAFCEKVVQRPGLILDDRFAEIESRNRNFEALYELVAEILTKEPRGHWSELLRSAGVPCGEVRTVEEAMLSRETAERNMVYEIPHPTAGTIPMIALPIKMSHTPAKYPSPPPLLGQHSAEILRELSGYDEGQIAALQRSGAVQFIETPPDTAESAA
jgi:formyl-CoA transferase